MKSILVLIDSQRQHVAAIEAKAAELARELEMARVKLAAYEEARAAMTGSPVTPMQALMEHRRQRSLGERRISSNWERIFGSLRDLGQAQFTTDEALAAAALAGVETNRNAVRSNLANYVNAGLVERVSEGVFRLTDLPESGH